MAFVQSIGKAKISQMDSKCQSRLVAPDFRRDMIHLLVKRLHVHRPVADLHLVLQNLKSSA